MILWLNGTFGAGKTTTVSHLLPELAQRAPGWRTFDPESVGYLLQPALADFPVTDFQHWPPWRRLVVAAVSELHEWTGQHLICPQTVLHPEYWQEIAGGLVEQGLDVVHVLIDAPADVLRERIEASGDAVEWRLEHLEPYAGARPWLTEAADLVVDVGRHDPAGAARQVLDHLAGRWAAGR